MNKTETKTDWEKELIEIEDYTDHEKAFLLWMLENDDIDPSEYENSASDMLELVLQPSDDEYNWEGMSDGAPGEYSVFTDDEADTACKEYLENYVDECVIHKIPESLRHYFDINRFIKDCMRDDERSHSLSHYDGEEHEITFNDEYYYIYRTN